MVTKRTLKTKRTNGGQVIASGAYGCVFNPVLKCVNATKREPNKITKLMIEENAIKEYEHINFIKLKLETIKNYSDYYLINDITICRPSKISSADLSNYTTKCRVLAKSDITSTNINSNLDKIMALNIQNGGLQVDDFLYDNGSFENIYKLHMELVKLLKKGIIPMNQQNIYHCDIKDSNILVDKSEFKPRLIDWGLSTEYIPFVDYPFPQLWRNRPFQFNVPFSEIIFTDSFYEKYTHFIKEGGIPNEEQLKPFVVDYINFWMKERGPGHFKFINEIMTLLFINDLTDIAPEEKPKVIEEQITMTYIVDYIIDVLVHFTKFKENGALNLREYIDNVFIQIVDIWGFISTYYPIIELLSNSFSSLSKSTMKIFKQLQFIFVEYLYNPRHEPIDMKMLYSDLKLLGQFLHINLHGSLDTYISPVSKSKSHTPDVDVSIHKSPEAIKNTEELVNKSDKQSI